MAAQFAIRLHGKTLDDNVVKATVGMDLFIRYHRTGT